MDSLCHPWFTTANLSYGFPIFETSATALRGTTGNYYLLLLLLLAEGSLEVKLPTIWADEKQSWEESEKRREEEKRSKRESLRRKKIQVRDKVGKSRNAVFFQWFVAPDGRKVGSLKRRVRSQLARWEMKNCTPLWREAHFEVKMYKTHHVRTSFGSWDVKQPVVARSIFRSQNVKNTTCLDHFWKLRCRKSARRCGAKHISKSKCTKHTISGPLLEVEMSKKCTSLWREAHFEVKCTKHTISGPLLEVEMSKKCTPLWREAHFEVKMLNKGSDHFLEVQMSFRVAGARDCAPCQKWARREGFVAFSTTTTTTPHYTPTHYTTTTTTPSLHYTTLHSTTLRYTTLHYATLHSTTLNYITLHYTTTTTTLFYIPLHYTTLHYTQLHFTTLLYPTLHYITLHYNTLIAPPQKQLQLHYTSCTIP